MRKIFVIELLSGVGYYNSNIKEFGSIHSATQYTTVDEALVRVAKLDKGFYVVKPVYII